MKVRYTWEIMHGDADHYDYEKLILTDKNEIAFFDFIIKLPFNRNQGVVYNEEEKEKLYELLKNIEEYNECDLENDLRYYFNDILYDWNYLKGDCTCDGMYYASTSNVERKKLSEKPKKQNIFIVYTNTNDPLIAKIFKTKKKALEFIENNKGLYLETLGKFKLE